MVYNENDYSDDGAPEEPASARPNPGDWLIIILSVCIAILYIIANWVLQ